MSLIAKRRQPDVIKVFAFDEQVSNTVAALYLEPRSVDSNAAQLLEAFESAEFLKRVPINAIDEVTSALEELSADRRASSFIQKTLGKCVASLLCHIADSIDSLIAQRALDRYRAIVKRTAPKAGNDETSDDAGSRRVERPSAPLWFALSAIETFVAGLRDAKGRSDSVSDSLCALRRVLSASGEPEVLAAVLSSASACARADKDAFETHFAALVDDLLGVYLDESAVGRQRSVHQSACETINTFWRDTHVSAGWLAHEELVAQLVGRCLRDAETEAREAEALHAASYRATSQIDAKLDASHEHLRALCALLDWVGAAWLRERVGANGGGPPRRPAPGMGVDAVAELDPRVTHTLLCRAAKKCCWIVLKSLLVRFTFGAAATGNRLVLTLVDACGRAQFGATKWQLDVLTRYIAVQSHVESTVADAALRRSDNDADEEGESSGVAFVRSFLRVVVTFIELNNGRLPVDVARDIVGPNATLLRRAALRVADRRTFAAVVAVYRALFASRPMQVIAETYRELVADLDVALNALLAAAGADRCTLLPDSTPVRRAASNVTEAEASILVTCSLLAELARTVSPLVSIHALDPPLFTMLTLCNLRSRRLMRAFPRAHCALIAALRAFAARHNHFVSTSSLCAPSGTASSTTTPSMQTGEHLTTILRIVTDLFRADTTATSDDAPAAAAAADSEAGGTPLSIELRGALTAWLAAIVRAEPAGRVLASNAFRDAFEAAASSCTSLPAVDARATRALLELAIALLATDARLRADTPLMAEPTLLILIELAYRVVAQLRAEGNVDERESRRLAFELLDRLPLCNYERMYQRSFDVVGPTAYTRRVRNEVFARTSALQRDTASASGGQLLVGTLSIENFVSLMRFILFDNEDDDGGGGSGSGDEPRAIGRLRALLRSVETLQMAKRGCELSATSSSWRGTKRETAAARRFGAESPHVTTAWCVWDAAQFCVATRLKTPLGARPDFLLYAIDARLRSLVDRLTGYARLHSGLSDQSNAHVDWLSATSVDAQLDSVARGSLLLAAVEQLERAVTNAHAGSAFGLPAAPRSVRAFFVANRRVCANWFAQLRPHVITVAHRLVDDPFAVVHHAFAYLRELDEREREPHKLDDSRADELESVCLYLAAALARLDAPHHIAALSSWLRSRRLLNMRVHSSTCVRFAWLDGFAALAAGSFERAIEAFRNYLATLVGLLPLQFTSNPDAEAATKRRHGLVESTRIVCASLSRAYEALGRFDDALEHFEETFSAEQTSVLLDGRLACLRALSCFGEPQPLYVPSDSTPRVVDVSLCSLVDVADSRLLLCAAFHPDRAPGQQAQLDELLDRCDAVRADVRKHLSLCSTADDTRLCGALQRFALHCRLARLLAPAQSSAVGLAEFVRDSTRACTLLADWRSGARPSNERIAMLLATERSLVLASRRLAEQTDEDARRQVQLAVARQLRRTGNVQAATLRATALVSPLNVQPDAHFSDSVLAERLRLLSGVPMRQSTRIDVLNELTKLLLRQRPQPQKAVCSDAQLELLTAVYSLSNSILRPADTHVVDPALGALLLRTTRYLDLAAPHLLGQMPLRSAVNELVRWFDAAKSAAGADWPLAALGANDTGRTQSAWTGEQRLLSLLFGSSCLLAPANANSFYILGSFSLRVARRAINRAITVASREEQPATSGGPLRLTSAYASACSGFIELDQTTLAELERCVPSTFPTVEFDRLVKVLTRVRVVRASAAKPDAEEVMDVHESELYGDEVLVDDDDTRVRAQLLAECGTLRYLSEACVQQLVAVRRRVLVDVFHEPLRVAASCLFRFLELVADSPAAAQSSSSDANSARDRLTASDVRPLRAALRLLRVLVRHRSKMANLLDAGFARVPAGAYRPLVPQLFARLVHPDAAVRRCVAELLGRIAASEPHSIVFPALVGASEARAALRRSNSATQPRVDVPPPAADDLNANDAGATADSDSDSDSDSAADENEERDGAERRNESGSDSLESDADADADEESDAERVAELLGDTPAAGSDKPDADESATRRKRRRKRAKRAAAARPGGARAAQAHAHYATLVETLRRDDPQLVAQVRVLIGELHRVTMLFEEIWLNALAHALADCEARSRRFSVECEKAAQRARQLAAETERERLSRPSGSNDTAERNDDETVDADADAAAESTRWLLEKHAAIHNATVFILERLARRTVAREPQTPFEVRFCAAFRSAVAETIRAIREPSNEHVAKSTSLLFGNLYSSIQEYAQKHAAGAYELASVSPRLAALRDTRVPVPGAPRGVTLRGIDRTVHTIMTRTRPKRFALIGSDGVRHTFLFKGLDDLHTDERCMQLLALINRFLTRTTARLPDALGSARLRTYSVTPTGARSGLIRYVDGVHSLFSIYKRWQVREAMAAQQPPAPAVSGAGAAREPSVTVSSPSELFNSKLREIAASRFGGRLSVNYTLPVSALAAGNVKIDRRRCGLPLLQAVLDELATETPRELLAFELLAAATCARDAVRGASQLARSTAAASAVGWLIGLGDRHPDNLLVDLERAEVVHIDYSVVFERGRFLKVPERIPFRLTRTLRRALACDTLSCANDAEPDSASITHDGPFRRALIHVLAAMREPEHRETLLLLLEAFLLDPLVDWGTHYLEHARARRRRARTRTAPRTDRTRLGPALEEDALSADDAPSEPDADPRAPLSGSASSTDADTDAEDEDRERSSRLGKVGDVLTRSDRRRLAVVTHWRLLVANAREAAVDWRRHGATLLHASRVLLVVARERLATTTARGGARDRLAALNAAYAYLTDERFSDVQSRASLPLRAVSYRAAEHAYRNALSDLRARRDEAVDWTRRFRIVLHRLARFDWHASRDLQNAIDDCDWSLEQLITFARTPCFLGDAPADRVVPVLRDSGQAAADQLRDAVELHNQLASAINEQRLLISTCVLLFAAYARAVAQAQPPARLLPHCRVAALAVELHGVSLNADTPDTPVDDARLFAARERYATHFVSAVQLRSATENAPHTVSEYESQLRQLVTLLSKFRPVSTVARVAPATPFDLAQRGDALRVDTVSRIATTLKQRAGTLGLAPPHVDAALTLTVFWTAAAAVPKLLDELHHLTVFDESALFRIGHSLAHDSGDSLTTAVSLAATGCADLCTKLDAELRRLASLSSTFEMLALLAHVFTVNCASLFDSSLRRSPSAPASPTPSVGNESLSDALATLCSALRSLIDRVGDHLVTFLRRIVPDVTTRLGALNDLVFAQTRRRIDAAHLETRLRHLDDVCADRLDALIFTAPANDATATATAAANTGKQREDDATTSRLIRELATEFDTLFDQHDDENAASGHEQQQYELLELEAARQRLKSVWSNYADLVQQLAAPFDAVTRAIESVVRVAQRDEAEQGWQPTELGTFVATAFAQRDALRDAFAVRALAARWRLLGTLSSFYAARCDAFDAARLFNDSSVAACVLDTVGSLLDRLALPLGALVLCYAEQCLLNREVQRYAPQAQILVLLAPGDPEVLRCYRDSLEHDSSTSTANSAELRVPLGIYNASSINELTHFANAMVEKHLAALPVTAQPHELVVALRTAFQDARTAATARRAHAVAETNAAIVRDCASRLRRSMTALRFVHSDIPQLASTRLDEESEFASLFDSETDSLSQSLQVAVVNDNAKPHEADRSALLSELKQVVQKLSKQTDGLTKFVSETLTQTDVAIARRLKWASGANPQLRTVLAEFDAAILARERFITSERQAAQRCVDIGRSLLLFETFRTRTSDAIGYDRSALAALDTCASTARRFADARSLITSHELAVLVDFPLPRAVVDAALHQLQSTDAASASNDSAALDSDAYETTVDEWWTRSYVEATQRIATLHAELHEGATRSSELRAAAALRDAVADWRTAYSRLRALVDRFREHIVSLARFENTLGVVPLRTVLRSVAHDADWPAPVTFGELKRLARRSDTACRDALVCANSLIAAAAATANDVDVVSSVPVGTDVCARLVRNVEQTQRCVALLVPLIPLLTAAAGDPPPPTHDTASTHTESVADVKDWPSRLKAALFSDIDSHVQSHADRPARDLQSTQKTSVFSESDACRLPSSVETFSQQCEFIWKRVVVKLDGHRLDGTLMSVEEQADRLIREATNKDNLARMYEGWVPWL